jgi:ankyrin repeat protein
MRRSIPATITNLRHFSLHHSTDTLTCVQLLLDHNADVYAHDNDGDTSLHESAGHGHPEITQMLLDRGAEVNFQNKNGSTPLLRVAQSWGGKKSNLQVVQLLLDHVADVHAHDHNGKTPFDVAFDLGKHEILPLLSPHGAE